MIKNVILKKIIKRTIFPFVTIINQIIPKDEKMIFFYSANKGIVYSNRALRSYLLDHDYYKRYKIYCGIEKMKYTENMRHVTFVSGLRAVLIFLRSSHVFYSAGQLPIKPSKRQCVIHMSHGNADFKRMGNSTNINNGDEFFFTYMIAPSDYYVSVMASQYNCSVDHIKVAGDPLCDMLLNASRNVYDFSKYDKMLVWVPTFRQSEELGYDDSHLNSLIPLFHEEDYGKLNDKLSERNIHLIVKLHPNQDAPGDLQRHFSHLSVFSHQEFNDSKYEIYTLMAHSDGLIGDYSSASMQYLLLDRPMAFVVPDLEDYGKTRGFVFEHPEDYMGGHIINTKEQFYDFINDFADGKDVYKEKRHWVCDQIYKFKDANSCKRIVELSGLKLD